MLAAVRLNFFNASNTTMFLLQKLSSSSQVVEQAFGRLKHRWRCSLKRCDAGVDNAIKIIGACVTLHNICEMRGDFFNDEEHRAGLESDGAPQFTDDEDSNTTEAERIKSLIKDYLSTLASSGCYLFKVVYRLPPVSAVQNGHI